MGCGGSKEMVEEEPVQESDESKALQERMEAEQKEEAKIIKLLVLGSAQGHKCSHTPREPSRPKTGRTALRGDPHTFLGPSHCPEPPLCPETLPCED